MERRSFPGGRRQRFQPFPGPEPERVNERHGAGNGLARIQTGIHEGVLVPGSKDWVFLRGDAAHAVGVGEFGVGDMPQQYSARPSTDGRLGKKEGVGLFRVELENAAVDLLDAGAVCGDEPIDRPRAVLGGSRDGGRRHGEQRSEGLARAARAPFRASGVLCYPASVDPAEKASIVYMELVGGAAVGRIVCPAVSTREAPIVQEEASAFASQFGWKLALDFSNVTLLSSVGLGILITLTKRCKEGGGRLALFGLSRDLVALVKLTKLDKLLAIADDEAGAIKLVT